MLLTVETFVAALGAVPVEDWCRDCVGGRTIMMRRTSKRVKKVVDKMSLPDIVLLRRTFWEDTHNGKEKDYYRSADTVPGAGARTEENGLN